MTNSPSPKDTEAEVVAEKSKNIVMECAFKGDSQRLAECFEDNEDNIYRGEVDALVNKRVENGNSPLDIVAILGKIEVARELVNHEVEINAANQKGYTALHRAALWGKIDVVKCLVENGADLQLRTENKERPREIAVRYNQTECVDYLDWAEAKIALQDTIKNLRETVADPEKVQGRLTKDDKNLSVNACNEKHDWLENTPDATTQDFITQKRELDDLTEPIWIKLSEPVPEGQGKK
ncbi:ankyrin repeat domain-containing protein 45-like [Tubulanus polymorphus]|uniref:ankyrin repeat domain-containing protein 45-like n=1 Tax=Tubulanus polymorphus TaxID=672921 RepID=UPI003DA38668